MLSTHRRRLATLLAAALLGLVGCGGEDAELDTQGVEDQVEEGVGDVEQELDDNNDG